jgi:hypothetical protein
MGVKRGAYFRGITLIVSVRKQSLTENIGTCDA